MQSTFVDANGDVRCPNCGARNSFTSKRTGKAKIMTGVAAVATVGIAAAAAPVVIPKRLKCNGCGTNLKRGDGSAPAGANPLRYAGTTPKPTPPPKPVRAEVKLPPPFGPAGQSLPS